VTLLLGILLLALAYVGAVVGCVLLLWLVMAFDVNDPRAWWAARKYRRLTQLPPATARQIKRSRLANRAELDAVQMPRLPRVPWASSNFDEGT